MRLGNAVSASWRASCAIRSTSRRWRVTSLIRPAMRRAVPAGSRRAAPQAVFVLEDGGPSFEVRRERGPQRRRILRVDAVEPLGRRAGRLSGEAEKFPPARRENQPRGAQVPIPDHLRRALQRKLVALVALAQRLLLLECGGLVAQQYGDARKPAVLAQPREQNEIAGQRPAVAGRAGERARDGQAARKFSPPPLRDRFRVERLEESEKVLPLGCAADPLRRRVGAAHGEIGIQLQHREPALVEQPREAARGLRCPLVAGRLACRGTGLLDLRALQERGQRAH